MNKTNYSTPTLEVEDVKVEKGYSLSNPYGDYGEAGQQSGYNDYDEDL
ncbi:MAG: hypothetical protein IJX40_06060 [Alistipes sp.]|nr:hypothetical protein [Alistipes sp.]